MVIGDISLFGLKIKYDYVLEYLAQRKSLKIIVFSLSLSLNLHSMPE